MCHSPDIPSLFLFSHSFPYGLYIGGSGGTSVENGKVAKFNAEEDIEDWLEIFGCRAACSKITNEKTKIQWCRSVIGGRAVDKESLAMLGPNKSNVIGQFWSCDFKAAYCIYTSHLCISLTQIDPSNTKTFCCLLCLLSSDIMVCCVTVGCSLLYNLGWVKYCTDFPEIQRDDSNGKLKSDMNTGNLTIIHTYTR